MDTGGLFHLQSKLFAQNYKIDLPELKQISLSLTEDSHCAGCHTQSRLA